MSGYEDQQIVNMKKSANLLYHYTNQDGLSGILKDSEIWATDYRFLNDTKEREHDVTQFSNAIYMHATTRPADSAGARIEKCLNDRKHNYIETLLRSIDAYYVSFTKEDLDCQLPLTPDSQFLGDRLSQWRGYAQNCQGISLGFNRDRLLSKAKLLQEKTNTHLSIEFVDCIYGDDLKNAIVGTINGNNAIKIENSKILNDCMVRFKHVGFEEEKETRLVIQMPVAQKDVNLVEFRNGQYGRTPYIKVPLGLIGQDSPLERIVVGPSKYMDQTVQSLEIELTKMGIQGVKVVASKISFRN